MNTRRRLILKYAVSICFLLCSCVLLTSDRIQAKSKSKSYDQYADIIMNYQPYCMKKDTGLIYANLIDFDQDGSYELYLLTSGKDETMDIHEQIYRMVKGKAKRIWFMNIGDHGSVNREFPIICKAKNQTYICHYNPYYSGQITGKYDSEEMNAYTYYTLKDGKFVDVETICDYHYYDSTKTNAKEDVFYSSSKINKQYISKKKYESRRKIYESKGTVDPLTDSKHDMFHYIKHVSKSVLEK